MVTRKSRIKKVVPAGSEPIRLDIGCGKNKKPGFVGIDMLAIDGVDVVADVTEGIPYGDNTVEEIHCSHFIEHLTNLDGKMERVKLLNECCRVMKPGAKMTLIFPYWASERFYGDPTHCEAISPFFFYYLKPEWRESQAPHTDARFVDGMYTCDFDATWGFSLPPDVIAMAPERQQYALRFYKESALDVHATLIKPLPKEKQP